MDVMRELARQFRGEQLRSVEANGLDLVESGFCRGGVLPSHRHHHAFISFLLAGSHIQRLPSHERHCAAATVVWHPAGELHEDHFVSDGHTLFLACKDDWLKTLPTDTPLLHQGRQWEGGLLYRFGLELYQALNRGEPIPSETVIDLISLCVAAEHANDHAAWLRRVLEWLNDEWCSGLTLTQA